MDSFVHINLHIHPYHLVLVLTYVLDHGGWGTLFRGILMEECCDNCRENKGNWCKAWSMKILHPSFFKCELYQRVVVV